MNDNEIHARAYRRMVRTNVWPSSPSERCKARKLHIDVQAFLLGYSTSLGLLLAGMIVLFFN